MGLFLVLLVSLAMFVEPSIIERQTRVDYDQPDHVMDKAELQALSEVMGALLNDSQWQKNHPHPCSYDPWPGIECRKLDDFQLHVTKIDVGSSPKSRCKPNATISPSIYKLPHLRALVLMSCFTSSNTTIPQGLDNLAPSLQILTLRKNPALTGTIPKELGSLQKLEVLSLSQNSLQGSVPPELGRLPKLQSLDLSYNLLAGSMPEELGHISTLSILDLSNNQLQGRIPDSTGLLVQLKKMDLSNNQLTGPIPSSIGNLRMLQFLALNKNTLTGGHPPEFWGNLGRITELRLSNSGYTGTIPESISSLRNLSELALDRNMLTGSIPPTLGNLNSIYHLNLSDNLLTGIVPFSSSFCSRLGGNLDVHGNPGLCTTNPMIGASLSDVKRCSGKASMTSTAAAVGPKVLVLLFSSFWVVVSWRRC